MSRISRFVAVALVTAGSIYFSLRPSAPVAHSRKTNKSPIHFTEVAAELGLKMRHGPGVRQRNLAEDTGSGVAWGDPDSDGDWDLYLVNYPSAAGGDVESWKNRLYQNDHGKFVDITDASGVGDSSGFGMGASFIDYDGDGDVDLYVTNKGPNRLFQNQGDGVFEEVGKQAGVDNQLWSTGVAWGDVDRDGDLDLYVCNYVEVFPADPNVEESTTEGGLNVDIPITLNPDTFRPQPNAFYLNNGDGTFKEMASPLGISNPNGRSLEAIFCDLDGNGWLDLYVNNDISMNHLFLNLGLQDGLPVFVDSSTATGTADFRGSMGLGVAELGALDSIADGLPDLYLTHWLAEENAAYRSVVGKGAELRYQDKAQIFQLAEPSLDTVGWGTALRDFDLDGRVDIFVANGNTLEDSMDNRKLVPEPLQIFWNQGEKFQELGAFAGSVFEKKYSGRGLAVADFDGDGDDDVVVNVNRSTPLLLRNDTESKNHSVKILLAAPDFLSAGARIEIVQGERHQFGWWVLEASFLSCHAPEMIFGLGDSTFVDTIRVQWADGSITEVQHVEAGVVKIFPDPSDLLLQ